MAKRPGQNGQQTDETAPAGPGQSSLDHGLAPVGTDLGLASGTAGHAIAVPAPILIPTGTLEAVTLLHICQCGSCGILYAVPLVTYAQRVEQSAAIYCPNGHSNVATPQRFNGTPAGMVEELQQLRCENLQFKRIVASFGPCVLTKKEISRRAVILSERQETLEYGHVLCPFCGQRKRHRNALRNHLYRQHLEDLKIEPAETFRL